MRVLHVDDSDVNRYTRNRVLTAAGFELVEASTGQEAHTLAAQVKPDLILLDIRLPDMSGFEVCRQLKQSATTRAIPVVLVSAIGREEHDYSQAVEHGAEAYLREPVEPALLSGIIHSLIRARRAEKQLEDELARSTREHEQSPALMATLLDHAPVGFVFFDADLRYRLVNQWMAEINGLSADAHVGRRAEEVVPALADKARRVFEQVMSTGQPVLDEEFVGETAKAQGETRYWSESWYPVRAAEGEIVGVGVVVVETTGQRRSTADMRASNEALRRSNEELQRFAYAVAHDLQEPLRSVQALSDLLERRHSPELGDTPVELLRLMRDGATRMSRMVSDLLKYSTVAAQTARPEQPIDSGSMLQAALANLQQCIHDSGATVTSDTLPAVIADEQLIQVFQNLIGNAIKYCGENSPQVHVSARRRGGDWVFSVKDNGIGFDMKYADKIFGVFHRLHGRDKFEGSGVGLAITKHIVERHGGRIWVDSEPNRGSTFFFTLPAASAEANCLQQAAELKQHGVLQVPSVPSRDFERTKAE